MAAHDLHHLCFIPPTTNRRIERCGNLPAILRTEHTWRDHAERLRVVACGVIEAMHAAARNAEDLPRPDADCLVGGVRLEAGGLLCHLGFHE